MLAAVLMWEVEERAAVDLERAGHEVCAPGLWPLRSWPTQGPLLGDGGLGTALAELETLARLWLDVVVAPDDRPRA
jgi:hypothetical protein